MSSSQSKSVAKSGGWKDELKFNTFSYQWTIDNFSSRTKKMKSSTFTVGDDEYIKWRLEVTPFHRRKDAVNVKMELIPLNGGVVHAKFKISIVGREETREISKLEISPTFTVRSGGVIDRDLLLDEENGLLLNDTLTVVCEMHLLTDTVTCGEMSPWNMNGNLLTLSDDFAQLLHSEELSDCTLSVEGKEFKVHKLILAARLPVFAAMFKHGMKETEGERIEISDIEPEVMQELIKYIYTGNAPKLNEMAMELLCAADKYQVDQLKRMCEEAAVDGGITAENACEMLVVSHLHSANQLKTHAIRCINKNADKVLESQGWNQMVKNYPELIADVVKAKNSSK